MNLLEFKSTLVAHDSKPMRFVLPNGKNIPAHYHITEVGHIRKDFIDCGGTVRTTSTCVLQAWVAANDENHRLLAGKLSTILDMAGSIFLSLELPVELEFEAPIISQFSIAAAEVGAGEIVFHLGAKHTDCLAKESCGLESSSCCSGDSDEIAVEDGSCCGSDKSTCC